MRLRRTIHNTDGSITVVCKRRTVFVKGEDADECRIDFVSYDPPMTSQVHSIHLSAKEYERLGRPKELTVTIAGVEP